MGIIYLVMERVLCSWVISIKLRIFIRDLLLSILRFGYFKNIIFINHIG